MINSFTGPIAAKEAKSRKGEASETALLINGRFVVLPPRRYLSLQPSRAHPLPRPVVKAPPVACAQSPPSTRRLGRIKGARASVESEESLISPEGRISFLPAT